MELILRQENWNNKRNNDSSTSIDFPINSQFAGIRIMFDCENCLRGETDASLAVSSAVYQIDKESRNQLFPEIEFLSGKEFLVEPWEIDSVGQRQSHTIKAKSNSISDHFAMTWRDLDSDRRSQYSWLYSGVFIGIGVSLIAEALVAFLYLVFNRAQRNES